MLNIFYSRFYKKCAKGESPWFLWMPARIVSSISSTILERLVARLPCLWFFLFVRHNDLYFRNFNDGRLLAAYRNRAKSLFYVVCYSGLPAEIKRSAIRYFSALREGGCLGLFLTAEEIYLLDKKEGASYCWFRAARLSPSPGGKITVLGPFGDLVGCSSDEHVLCIKPERFNVNLSRSVYAYYNVEDMRRHEGVVRQLVSQGKVEKVLTPNSDFCSESWVVAPPKVILGIYGAQPLALINIANALYVFGWQSIELRGFNFYLGKEVYPSVYSSSLRSGEGVINFEAMLSSLARHDLLINLLLLKYFFREGLVCSDGHLSYLASIEVYEYLQRFEEKYSGRR